MSVNPKTSIEALFPRPIDCGMGVEVYPLSLAHYALLEKIGSYLIGNDHQPDALEVVKTYYVCTHPAREVLDNFDNLDTAAFDWAEKLPPCVNGKIADAVLRQIDAMSKVVPITDDGGSEKKADAGSSQP